MSKFDVLGIRGENVAYSQKWARQLETLIETFESSVVNRVVTSVIRTFGTVYFLANDETRASFTESYLWKDIQLVGRSVTVCTG